MKKRLCVESACKNNSQCRPQRQITDFIIWKFFHASGMKNKVSEIYMKSLKAMRCSCRLVSCCDWDCELETQSCLQWKAALNFATDFCILSNGPVSCQNSPARRWSRRPRDQPYCECFYVVLQCAIENKQ